MTILNVACVQMRSGVTPAANLIAALDLVREAAKAGAQLIATPEMTNILDIRPGGARGKIRREEDDETLPALQDEARDLGIWLLVGSLAIVLPGDDRKANRSFLIGPDGAIAARYDKINMFDVEVDDGQSYRESRAYRAGDRAVVAKTPFGQIGLTVCYDVRFPGLYRTLAQAGAEIITCPAAFTRVTGAAHWHVLLRARAIETGCFIIAPAQGGKHEDGRETFGHSLIVSPWGEIIAEADHAEPGIVLASINLAEVSAARRKIPAWNTDRSYSI